MIADGGYALDRWLFIICERKMELKKINKKVDSFDRRGISALVGTVMLIVFVVSFGLIVINWSSKLVEKGIKQSESKIGSELECADVNIRLDADPGEASKIIIKNNNLNSLSLKGFIVRFFINDNVIVDYANENTEIKSFSAMGVDFSNHQTKKVDGGDSVLVNWDGKKRIEVIPRVDIGEEIVNCDSKKIIWEK